MEALPGMGKSLLFAGLVLFLAGSALTWRALTAGPQPAGEPPRAATIVEPVPLPAFALRGPRGGFRNADLLGRWSFVFFGYTQCPDICPTALALMRDLKATLAAVPSAPTFQVVFVSVDPRRDTNALLDEYLRAFDPAFVGISGGDPELASLASALGVRYQRNDSTDPRHYTVDHSAAIHLVDPQGRLAASFPPPQELAAIAGEFRRIVAR